MPFVLLPNHGTTPLKFDVYGVISLFRIGDRADKVHPVIVNIWVTTTVAGVLRMLWDEATKQAVNESTDIDEDKSGVERIQWTQATADQMTAIPIALGIDIFESLHFERTAGIWDIEIEFALAEGGMKFDIGVFLPEIRQIERSIAAGDNYFQPPVYNQVGNEGL